MIKPQTAAATVLISVAALLATPALASPVAENPRFQQPLLVPGAVWSFHVPLDALHPQNVGQILHGSFALAGVVDNQVQVTWTMATEKQVLAADIFTNKIVTVSIADLGAGIDLALTPSLVHFEYPLHVGQSWSDQANFSGVFAGHPLTGVTTSTFQVVREENVVTPAGTFDALVLVNDMGFPALGQQLQATLWVTSDGLLVRRESRMNGVLVQVIELADAEVPVPSMMQQTVLGLGLLRDELKREQRDDAVVEAGLRVVENTLSRGADRPREIELLVARVALRDVARHVERRGAPADAASLVAFRVLDNQLQLTAEQLRQNESRGG
jgi:hypothetical protein